MRLAFLLAFALVYALFIVVLLHERKTHLQTMNKLAICQAELQATQENLLKYTQLYTDLRNKCELQKKQIEQRYTALLKKASEPIPQVSIPPHADECEALKEMLNEASKHFSP
jgi:hypothetical protein